MKCLIKLLRKRQQSAVVERAICTTSLMSLVFNNIPIIKKPFNQFFELINSFFLYDKNFDSQLKPLL